MQVRGIAGLFAVLAGTVPSALACGDDASSDTTDGETTGTGVGGADGSGGGLSSGGSGTTTGATGGDTSSGTGGAAGSEASGTGGVPNAGGGDASGNGGGDGGQSGSGAGGTSPGAGGSSGTQGCPGDCEPVTCEGTFMLNSDEEFSEFVELGCTAVTGNLQITQTGQSSLSGLVIESVGGNLVIAANSALTSLAGLERVAEVGTTMTINNNAQLLSLGPLLSWPAGTVGESMSIQNNQSLPQCEVDALDARLTASCNNCNNNDDDGTCD